MARTRLPSSFPHAKQGLDAVCLWLHVAFVPRILRSISASHKMFPNASSAGVRRAFPYVPADEVEPLIEAHAGGWVLVRSILSIVSLFSPMKGEVEHASTQF